VREVQGVRPRIIPCRVERLEKPAPDVAVIGLRLPMNENFRFLAGQYIDLLLKDGRRRSYSIGTRPDPGGVTAIELHVRHTPGGAFTDHAFSALKVRDLLRFEGPLGSFYLREESHKPIVMVASGTGFAPIKAMCEYAFEKKLELKRPITLYWGCRARRDLYMLEVPRSWQRPGFRFVPVLSDAAMPVDRAHRLRPPPGDARFPRHGRHPGLRLRRAGDGRRRARRFQRTLRPAGR
jgi:CDP-4-dehydro-6-deoxyglucose reductase